MLFSCVKGLWNIRGEQTWIFVFKVLSALCKIKKQCAASLFQFLLKRKTATFLGNLLHLVYFPLKKLWQTILNFCVGCKQLSVYCYTIIASFGEYNTLQYNFIAKYLCLMFPPLTSSRLDWLKCQMQSNIILWINLNHGQNFYIIKRLSFST